MIMRIIFTFALATLFACSASTAQQTDLQGNAIDAPRAIESLEQFTADAPTPNQSYLAKQMQYQMAGCLAPMIWELSYGAQDIPAPYYPSKAIHTPGDWRVTDQVFHYRGTVSGQESGAYVKFSNARWDPQHSKLNYGPKRVATKAIVESDAKTKLIQNDSDAAVDVSYDESESLTDSYSMSVTKGLTMDMNVSSTQEVGGSYAGVEAKVSLTEEFGISKTSEQTQEESHEGTHEEALSIEFTASPGEYYLVTITKEHETVYQDFWINGVMDFDIEVGWGHENAGRQRSRRPSGTVHLQGVAGLEQFVQGYDTNYPSMQGFWSTAYTRTQNGIACVTDLDRRTIEVSGTNQNNLEDNADYKVESLGNKVPDAYAHLPVEHADDVNDPPQSD